METKYVRITNEGRVNYNKVVPVRRADEGNWIVDLIGCEYYLAVEDCEVVPHPSQQPQTYDIDYKKSIEAAQDVLADFVHPESPMSESEAVNRLLSILDDRNLVRKIKSEGVGEGHTITTEQLKAIEYYISENVSMAGVRALREWFPTVFAPAKTYKPSERIIHGDDELMLIRSGDTWNLLDVNTGLTRKVSLITESHTAALSEEQLQYLLAGSREEAMQGFNDYDSYLPEALKGDPHV